MKETFSVRHSVSNLQKNTDQARIKYLVRDKIARELAQHIADCTIKEDVGDFSTTYSCRVIVADVDDFYRLVCEFGDFNSDVVVADFADFTQQTACADDLITLR